MYGYDKGKEDMQMQKEQEKLAALVRGKKVAFIGAGVSHKALIQIFADLGAKVTLCDKKESLEAFTGAYTLQCAVEPGRKLYGRICRAGHNSAYTGL